MREVLLIMLALFIYDLIKLVIISFLDISRHDDKIRRKAKSFHERLKEEIEND